MTSLNLNLWGILVSGAVHWLIGALWYSPLLFGNVWAKAKGIDVSSPDHGASPVMYLSGLLVGWLLAIGVAVLLSLAEIGSVPGALGATALLWLSFTCAPMFANAVFGGSFTLWAIDSTYPLVSSLLIALLLTIW
jgi:hypothetical protein